MTIGTPLIIVNIFFNANNMWTLGLMKSESIIKRKESRNGKKVNYLKGNSRREKEVRK